ncbi:hypothetical protein OEA41_008927 [Lepraria neglecta]|uniref:25S rRNA adenine-N(1) methyltransferase n=1 Tax=Lepraria neglecta TaxID=209136 RepID=A0AAE0DJR1_9LECA|nr:hypothetical protein OEA41_008927 [Lepraria neglecta]
MALKKKARPRLLSSTRPRNIKPTPSLSSHATRTLVRSHHTLRKQLSCALAQGDDFKAESIKYEIEAAGGLRKYQEASIQGQSAERGGDTSKVLLQWLLEVKGLELVRNASGKKFRMLEVGALRTDNTCSRNGAFEMKRIDLHSQHSDIEEQDFMELPFPATEDLDQEGFDIVSLSLVVNFVGDPAQRGEMLKRVEGFLRPCSRDGDEMSEFFPTLFLVLPAPCVTNSRYLDEEKLKSILEILGYTMAKRKLSSKLVYYLWRYEGSVKKNSKVFKKEEIRSGRSRNNFAIVLR